MGIRKIIAIGLGFIALSAQAATNSWTYAGGDYWDNTNRWSLGHAPTNTDSAVFITNVVSKIVRIDDFIAAVEPDELTISNLTVSGPTANQTNTLALVDMNDGDTIPLEIFNTMIVSNRGLLQVTNSMLQVDGTFQLIGAMQVLQTAGIALQSATIGTNATLLFALGTDSSPVVVSNNLTLGGTLNVIDGGGLTTTTYTLFTYGGTLTYNGLTVGSAPTNFMCTVSTSTAGQVDLIVTPAVSSVVSPQIISITQSGTDITVMWTMSAAGTNFVQAGNSDPNGVYNTNNYQNVDGPLVVSAGVTNSYTDVGGATNRPSRFYRILYSH